MQAGLIFGLAFLMRGLASLGSVLLSVMTARLGGPDGLAALTIFLSALGLGGLVARRGMTDLLVRNVARLEVRGATVETQSLLFAYCKRTLWLLFPAMLIGLAAIWMEYRGGHAGTVMLAFCLTLPLMVFLALFASYLTGQGKPWLSPVFDQGGASLLAAMLLVIAGLFGLARPVFVFTASVIFLVFLAHFYLRRERRVTGAMATPRRADAKGLLDSGQFAFFVIGMSIYVSQVGSFLLAAPFLNDTTLGLVRGAERLALMVSFPILVLNPLIAPKVVRLAEEHDWLALRRLLFRSMLVSGAIGALPFSVLTLFPDWSLSLLGPQFPEAQTYLQVLSMANIVVALLAPATMVLNMAGGERQAMHVQTSVLLLSLFLFPLLSYGWSGIGFVAAYTLIAILRSGIIFAAALRLGGLAR